MSFIMRCLERKPTFSVLDLALTEVHTVWLFGELYSVETLTPNPAGIFV